MTARCPPPTDPPGPPSTDPPAGRAAAGRSERVRAAVVGVVAMLGVLWPLGRGLYDDSFPFSNFPMFTHDPARTTGFQRAVGVAADGTDVRLSPELIGGTVEVIHAAQTVTTALRQGRAAELCAEIADRVARSGLAAVEVLIVTDRFDIVDGLRADDPQPVTREEHTRCPVVSS